MVRFRPVRPASALLQGLPGPQLIEFVCKKPSQSHQPTFSAPKHSGRIPPLGMPNAGQGQRSVRALLQHAWHAL